MEKISQVVCSDCGKELDSKSARLFQMQNYGELGREWIQVNWAKRGVRQANGRKPQEMILCSPCAEAFHKKHLEDEWRDMKVALVLVVLTVLGIMVAVYIFVFHIIK